MSVNELKERLKQGVLHYRAGRFDDAERLFDAVLRVQPQNPLALDFLGAVCAARGQYARSIDLAKKAITAAPDYVDAYVHLATPLIKLGRLVEAKKVLAAALKRNADSAPALVKLASVELNLGSLGAALSASKKAIELDRKNVAAHLRRGDVLRAARELERAEAHYRSAIELQPKSSEAHHLLGLNAWAKGDIDEAITSVEQSLALRPTNMSAHLDLFHLHEYANDHAKMRKAFSEAIRIWPDNDNFKVLSAQLLRIDGDDAAARCELEGIDNEASLVPILRRRRFQLLAEILERDGEYDKAFECYEKNNAVCADSPDARASSPEAFMAKLETSIEKFTQEWTNSWRWIEPEDGRESPVFLVGFPRSGTTLLENFLRGHEGFVVLEEKPISNAAILALERMPDGDPGALAQIADEELAALRQSYFDALGRFLNPSDRSKTVIDKQPMNMTRAGALYRMFPDAKYIFVERLPHDCVLSAFTKTFLLNAMSANFLTLERTALTYDRAMTLWRQYKNCLPLNVFTVQYETLIEDPEQHLRELIAWLGVEWRAGVLDHVATAQRRKNITSASRNQVTQSLYTTSRGRWRPFEKHLEPVRPILDKWAARLGYEV